MWTPKMKPRMHPEDTKHQKLDKKCYTIMRSTNITCPSVILLPQHTYM